MVAEITKARLTRMRRPEEARLSRDVPFDARQTALLIIDLQNYFGRRESELYGPLSADEIEAKHGSFFRRLEEVTLPAIQRLQAAFRENGVEVVFTVVESLTQDGRERSLDYKISRLQVAKGSWEAKVLEPIQPQGDEIVLPKTASSVFNATNIEYVLRNMGIDRLVICGALTDQCVDSAVRDAADRGFLVTVVDDGCASYSEERHETSLRLIAGYCRRLSADEVIAELRGGLRKAG